MGAIGSTLQLGVAYCCCNTTSSLFNTCLGSRSPNSTGRKRSVLLLSLVILCSLFFQYYVAPSILHENTWWDMYKAVPGMGKRLFNCWTSGCQQYDTDDTQDLYHQCVGNAAVYRPTFVSTIFFAVSAIITKMNPSINREVWPAKIGMYFIGLTISMFLPNPLFTGFYLLLLRLCAMVFVVIQQVILIDMAYNWNESWVERSNYCESLEWGSGKKWLRAIVATAVLMYIASFIGIYFLYKVFTGCGGNTAVITLTLVGILIISGVQLTSTEGSLLTTSVISAYMTYLAYSTVSKNPNAVCNPTLGNEDLWGIAVGLFFTMISLAWTGWSWTAQDRLSEEGIEATRSLTPTDPSRPDPANLNLDVPFINPEDRPTTGVVMESESTNLAQDEEFNRGPGASIWKLNVVLVLISCWVAASLTGWGSITGGIGETGDHTAANPLVGKFNMVMIAVSQNVALLLYLWTLIAPQLFPDRDFS